MSGGSDAPYLPPEDAIKLQPPAGQPPAPRPAPEPEPARHPPRGDGLPKESLTAALLFAAGALHLALVDDHLAHARGAGLFFLGIGFAQVAWSFLYLRRPTEVLGRVGLAGLVIAPSLLYVLTRIVRAPWSDAPEAVDLLGVVTLLAQLGALVPLWSDWRPRVDAPTARAVLGVGVLLTAGLYTSAIAAENVDWLSEAQEAHSHGPGGHDDHGDHAGHGGHGGDFVGVRGEVTVGNRSYYGPADGTAISDWCRAVGHPDSDCWLTFLNDMVVAEGSIPAFDALVELTEVEPDANARSHDLAHVLGHTAYQAYGLNVSLTLGECSYEVFQGCIHGALQAFFNDLAAQGLPLDEDSLGGVCDAATSSFERYTCYHGVGHGVMMHSTYDLHGSLETCDLLRDWFDEASCYGGVFMENVVAYLHSLDPDYVPHDHGGGPPVYWVDEEDPAYPCNVVDDDYKRFCWKMQTSLVLHFNGGDFEAASGVCDEAGKQRLACYASLGRDAAPHAGRDPGLMMQFCSHGAEDAQHVCVKAFTAGVMLQANTPEAGLDLCPQLPEDFRATCYKEVGNQADSRLKEAAEAFCDDRVPEAYREACHEGRA